MRESVVRTVVRASGHLRHSRVWTSRTVSPGSRQSSSITAHSNLPKTRPVPREVVLNPLRTIFSAVSFIFPVGPGDLPERYNLKPSVL
jgi:hypothetical protein